MRTSRRRDPGLTQTPRMLAIVAGIAGLFIALPFVGLAVNMPWSDLTAQLGRPDVHDALRLSVLTASAAALISVIAGVPLAWILARASFRGAGLVRSLVAVPMVLPPVVAGVLMVFAFGRHGLLGHQLASLGISLPYTTQGVVAVQTFISMPFVIVTAENAFRDAGVRHEHMAATLGASPWSVFRSVAVPLNRRSLQACAVLAWARALGEFGATITFAGNFPGRTRTMPLAISLALQSDPVVATTLSLVLVAVSAAVLVAVHRAVQKEAFV